MKVVCRYRRRDGTREAKLKDFATDEEVVLVTNRRETETGGRESLSAAVPLHQLAEARKLDQRLGVNDEYVVRDNVAYKVHPSAASERRWLKAHRWVNHNAGYGDPVPGDFVPLDQQRKPGPRMVRAGG